MPRNTRINWNDFIKLRNELSEKIEAAMCKYCKKIIQNYTSERLQTHRNACRREPEENVADKPDNETYTHNAKRVRLQSNTGINQKELMVDECDIESMKNDIDKLLAKFFFACNIPYRVVGDYHFLELVKMLCKIDFNYKPSCRQVLASLLLHDVYKDITAERKVMFQNTPSVLLVDGWRNKSANRKLIVCSMRNVNILHAFLSFTDASLEKEDGDTLSKLINGAIEITKNKYETDIFAIVTDNDSKIVCGGRLAKAIDDKSLWQSTCSSHSGNLLIKSLVDPSLREKLRDIVNIFRDPKLDTLVKRLGGTKLQNFPETRFCYLRDTCESVSKNLNVLQQICMLDDIFINEQVFELIFDEDFKSELQSTIETLTPICKLINNCQNPLLNVADAVQLWLTLALPTDDYNQQIKARIKKALWPVGYAANLLHPKYQGRLLDNDQRRQADDFLRENLDEQSRIELENFFSDTNISSLIEKCSDAIPFWTLCQYKFPYLSKIAIKLMLIPASTASLEGYFSSWTYVHSTHRNRLKNENSSELVDIYYTLKLSEGSARKSSEQIFDFDNFLSA